MNPLRSFARVILFTFQNISRNFWLSFITLTVFVLTLLTINVVIFMNVVADSVLEAVEQKVEVTYYFVPHASEDIVSAAQGYLRGFSQVRDVQFVSAQEALEQFISRYATDDIILSSLNEVGENPFGHSLVVTAYSTDDFTFLAQAMQTPEFSEYIKEQDFTDYEQIIAKIRSLSTRVGYAGFALAGLFGLIAILIIFNTIRVAIYVHRDEIAIMKLVGARNWFVRGPFILEALLYSALATIIMAVSLLAILALLRENIVAYFAEASEGIFLYFEQYGPVLFLAQFLLLCILSLLTTAFAMRKYLKT